MIELPLALSLSLSPLALASLLQICAIEKEFARVATFPEWAFLPHIFVRPPSPLSPAAMVADDWWVGGSGFFLL
jgi:hypothetical protein